MDIVKTLNEMELDILKETSNIGCSHAATAISQMINKQINLSVPAIKFIEVSNLRNGINEMSGNMGNATGVYLELTEDFCGSILYIFSEKSALALSDLLMGREVGSGLEMGEMENSAIMEIGNIIVSAYANALGDFVESRVLLTPPVLKYNLPDSIMEELQKNIGEINTALVFDTKMEESKNLFESSFILLPHPRSMERIINKLLKNIE